MEVKAFIFSIDALFAALVLLFAGMLFIASANSGLAKEKQFDLMKLQAADEARIGFMLNKPESILAGNEKNAYCGKVFLYNPDNPLGEKAGIESKDYCAGAGS